jgi:hypothetical protein
MSKDAHYAEGVAAIKENIATIIKYLNSDFCLDNFVFNKSLTDLNKIQSECQIKINKTILSKLKKNNTFKDYIKDLTNIHKEMKNENNIDKLTELNKTADAKFNEFLNYINDWRKNELSQLALRTIYKLPPRKQYSLVNGAPKSI